MLRLIASIGLGAMIALSPFHVAAATSQPAATAAARHTHHTHHVRPHTSTGSFRSEMRNRSNLSKERARAGAEHVRNLQGQ